MFLTLLACFGSDDEPAGDSTATDSTPQEIEAIYPTQEKVLIYYGHGGEPGESSGIGSTDDIELAIADEYGWSVERRDSLGQPENFRAIILVDPGAREPYSWAEEDADKLRTALDTGTRLIVLVELGNCSADTVNPLLEMLDASARLVAENSQATEIIEPSAHQITDGVGQVYLQEPCVVETNGATPLFTASRYTYGSAERPATGGDIVVIGDYSFLDDTGKYDNGDNMELIRNLVEVDPAL
ncbi:MAG: hypothetical protein GY913_26720 [Proteobacteria bacterium]|nr:hypothetical protein [Pseudomonadota bacterium]MCP4920510.1 hypothetical protein [Pseudomonadota bacterium]